MKLTKKEAIYPIVEPMLPLINIVFLLIIFFMVAGHIATPINGIAIPHQQQKNMLTQQEKSQEKWLFISENGKLTYQQKTLHFSALATVFSEHEHISLLADGSITTGELEKITSELSNVGVKTVALITQLSLPSEADK